MLMLISSSKETLKAGVFILQCVQLGIISPEEARNMLFIDGIGAKQ